jgi:hypothetical protein
MLLLNLVEAQVDTPLGHLLQLVKNVDTLSHLLVWSYSEAVVGEDAEISLVEFPRLKLRFALGHDSEGQLRFFSLGKCRGGERRGGRRGETEEGWRQ